MNFKNFKGSLLLLIATAIWGTAFVFQEEAVALGSFTLNGLRYILGGIILIPLVLVSRKTEKKRSNGSPVPFKNSLIAGILCGVALAVAANLQQFGIMFNASLASGDSGKAGFITAMYIIFVPVLSTLLGKRLTPSVILSVLLSVGGLYLISVKSGFSIALGDVFLLLCALSFAVHIMTVDKFVCKVDPIALSSVQFFTVGVVSLVLALIFEMDNLSLSAVSDAIWPILYLGIMSSGVAYTLQVLGQKHSEATVASLVMSLESVFAMLAACVFYTKAPTPREVIGCFVMLIAIFIIQTPFIDNAFRYIKASVCSK